MPNDEIFKVVAESPEQITLLDNTYAFSFQSASKTTYGVVKIGDNIDVTNGVINVDTSDKVDKVEGKGLSENDLTDALKTAYDAAVTHASSEHAPSDAEKNVQSDWNQTDTIADDYIKNKPAVEETSNKATAWGTPDDTKYPTTKLVDDRFDAVEASASALWDANLVKSVAISGNDLFVITYCDGSTSNILTLAQLKSLIGDATTSLNGLMSIDDKAHLDTLVALLESDEDTVINTIAEILAVFENYPEGYDIATELAKKVDKVEGKELSTNDYTDLEQTKLGTIEENAQVNVLEGVKLNGVDLPITDKKVNIETADLEFDKTADYSKDGLIAFGAKTIVTKEEVLIERDFSRADISGGFNNEIQEYDKNSRMKNIKFEMPIDGINEYKVYSPHLMNYSENLVYSVQQDGLTVKALMSYLIGNYAPVYCIPNSKMVVGYKGTPTSITVVYQDATSETITSFVGNTYKYAIFTIPSGNNHTLSITVTPSETIDAEFLENMELFAKILEIDGENVGNLKSYEYSVPEYNAIVFGSFSPSFRNANFDETKNASFSEYSIWDNSDFSDGLDGWYVNAKTAEILSGELHMINADGYRALNAANNTTFYKDKTYLLAIDIDIVSGTFRFGKPGIPDPDFTNITLNNGWNYNLFTMTSGGVSLPALFAGGTNEATIKTFALIDVDYLLENNYISSMPSTYAELFDALKTHDEYDFTNKTFIQRVDDITNNLVINKQIKTTFDINDTVLTAWNYGIESVSHSVLKNGTYDTTSTTNSKVYYNSYYSIDVLRTAMNNNEIIQKLSVNNSLTDILLTLDGEAVKTVQIGDNTAMTPTANNVTIPLAVPTGEGQTDGILTHEDKAKIDTIDNKVDKVEGKELSTNDYTDLEQTKLGTIEENAEVNIIEVVKDSDSTPLEVASEDRSVTLTKSVVGLGNVDNTSDVNKPVSTAQGAALDTKPSIATFDGATGTVSFYKETVLVGGETPLFTVDLPTEALVVSGAYDAETEIITLTLANGSTIEIDASGLINSNELVDAIATKLGLDFSALNAMGAIDTANDLVAVRDVSGTAETKKVAVKDLVESAGVMKDISQLGDATIDDTDYMLVGEGGTPKKATIGALKNHLKTPVSIDTTNTERIESTYGSFVPHTNGIPMVKEIQGLTVGAIQLVTNGDFSNGTTGWFTYRGNGVVNNKVYTLTGNTTDTFMAVYNDQQSDNTTDIFYLYGYVMTPNTVSNIRIAGDVNTAIVLTAPIVNEWYFLSGIRRYINTRGRHQFQLDNTSINTNILNIKNTGRINISTLIANKQYSPLYNTTFDLMSEDDIKTQMDLWVQDNTLPHAVQSLTNTTIKSVGKNLFDKYAYETDYALKIHVKPSQAYVWGVSTAYKLYDSDNLEIASGTATSVTTTASTKYIAFSGIADIDTFQFEYGSTATSYKPYVTETQVFNATIRSAIDDGTIRDKIRYDNGKYVIDRYVDSATGLALATPLLANETVDVDGTLIQDSVTTLYQEQDLSTVYKVEWSMNAEQSVATLVQRDKLQQEEIDELEDRLDGEAFKTIQIGDNPAITPTANKIIIPLAVPTGEGQADGAMTHEDKAKIDRMEDGAQVNILEGVKLTDNAEVLTPDEKIITIPAVTLTTDGLMPSEDKVYHEDSKLKSFLLLSSLTSTIRLTVDNEENTVNDFISGRSGNRLVADNGAVVIHDYPMIGIGNGSIFGYSPNGTIIFQETHTSVNPRIKYVDRFNNIYGSSGSFYNPLVRKFDSLGRLVYAKELSTTPTTENWANFFVDENENLYVSNADEDKIIKLDKYGNIIWEHMTGDNLVMYNHNDELFYKDATTINRIDYDNNIVWSKTYTVIGYVFFKDIPNSINFTINFVTDTDYVVLENAYGNLVGTPIATSDATLIAVGSSSNYYLKTATAIKKMVSGSEVWSVELGDYDIVLDVEIDSDDNLYILSSVNYNLTKIYKLNSNGGIVWENLKSYVTSIQLYETPNEHIEYNHAYDPTNPHRVTKEQLQVFKNESLTDIPLTLDGSNPIANTDVLKYFELVSGDGLSSGTVGILKPKLGIDFSRLRFVITVSTEPTATYYIAVKGNGNMPIRLLINKSVDSSGWTYNYYFNLYTHEGRARKRITTDNGMNDTWLATTTALLYYVEVDINSDEVYCSTSI